MERIPTAQARAGASTEVHNQLKVPKGTAEPHEVVDGHRAHVAVDDSLGPVVLDELHKTLLLLDGHVQGRLESKPMSREPCRANAREALNQRPAARCDVADASQLAHDELAAHLRELLGHGHAAALLRSVAAAHRVADLEPEVHEEERREAESGQQIHGDATPACPPRRVLADDVPEGNERHKRASPELVQEDGHAAHGRNVTPVHVLAAEEVPADAEEAQQLVRRGRGAPQPAVQFGAAAQQFEAAHHCLLRAPRHAEVLEHFAHGQLVVARDALEELRVLDVEDLAHSVVVNVRVGQSRTQR